MSNLDSLLKAPLLRVLLRLDVSGILKGVLNWSVKISNHFCGIWLVCLVWTPWGSPLLLLGIWRSDRSFRGVSFGLLIVPKLSISWDFPKFLEGLIWNCKWCPYKSCPCLVFYRLVTKKLSWALFLDIWHDYFWSRLYSFSVKRRE